MTLQIPVLETDRLILRGLKNEDLTRFSEMMADEEVIKFIGGQTLDRSESWRNMAMITGHWALRSFGFFAIEEKSTGNFLGRVGPWMPEGWPALEVGWTLHRGAWGKGYATEATACTIDWIFSEKPELDELISIIDENNVASQKVAARLGSQKTDRIFHFKGGEYPIWSVSRTAWNARQ